METKLNFPNMTTNDNNEIIIREGEALPERETRTNNYFRRY